MSTRYQKRPKVRRFKTTKTGRGRSVRSATVTRRRTSRERGRPERKSRPLRS